MVAPELETNSHDAQSHVRHHWWIPLLVLITATICLYLLQTATISITSKPSADFYYIVWTADFLLFAWLMTLSRLKPINRFQALCVYCVLHVIVSLLFTVDGYAGDGRAIVRWRWWQTPEEQFELRQKSESSPTAVADLSSSGPTDFPSFRGRDRSGVIRSVMLDHDWENSPPELMWRQPIGRGWSSFVTSGKYCVTQEQRRDLECVVCYEIETGRECWVHSDRARFEESTGGDGPRATPTIQSGRVFVLGATGILNCLDGSNGEPIWTVNILKECDTKNCLFGMTGSPLLMDDVVVVFPGGKGHSVAAFSQATGKKVWSGGDAGASYSSPHLVTLRGRRMILSFNAEGLFGHDASDGKPLWKFAWVSNPEERNNVCQPVPIPNDDGSTDRLFIASGYGKGCTLLRLEQSNDSYSLSMVWANTRLKAKFTSVVFKDGLIYGLDERILTCIDVETGDRRWKGGRYGYGQILLVDDVLLVQAEDGYVALVDASPDQYRELARFPALADRTWNHPALAGEFLILRNDREAICLRLPLRAN